MSKKDDMKQITGDCKLIKCNHCGQIKPRKEMMIVDPVYNICIPCDDEVCARWAHRVDDEF